MNKKQAYIKWGQNWIYIVDRVNTGFLHAIWRKRQLSSGVDPDKQSLVILLRIAKQKNYWIKNIKDFGISKSILKKAGYSI